MYHKTLLLTSTALILPLSAATITWGSAYNFNNTDQTLWLNSFDSARNGGTAANGPLLSTTAIDYGNNGAAPINGIAFTEETGSTDYWGNNGINSQIDNVLSGHKTLASGVNTGTFSLTGLTLGKQYQIQLIGIHDSRGTINQRQYEISFGGSDFTTGGTPTVLTRGAYGNSNPANPATIDGQVSYGTVVGTFIADGTTQDIQIRSNTQDTSSTDDLDPGLGGYILLEQNTAIPEPSSTSLLGLASLTLILRRRK